MKFKEALNELHTGEGTVLPGAAGLKGGRPTATGKDKKIKHKKKKEEEK